MRKRQLQVDNERLIAEVSYLRGRIEELQRAPAEVVGHVREMVAETMRVFTGPPTGPPAPIEPFDPGMDWTDQLAPRTVGLSEEDYARISHELNDQLVIADELDRDP